MGKLVPMSGLDIARCMDAADAADENHRRGRVWVRVFQNWAADLGYRSTNDVCPHGDGDECKRPDCGFMRRPVESKPVWPWNDYGPSYPSVETDS